ncbi:hypothetical protein [Candidatus Korobacter versatilis]|nr:hypothetical protein [Candidatus Koribacter versatilis]
MNTDIPLAPYEVVARGKRIVTLPVMLIMFGTWGAAWLLANKLKQNWILLASVLLGPGLAWVWWSWMVPRWRRWAATTGADMEEVEILAVNSGLIWPKGHVLEKTEFRKRD